MKENSAKVLMIAGALFGSLALIWYAQSRPGLFSNNFYLGGILLLELILASLWHYERTFLPFLMIVFLWAGMNLPWATSMGLTARWFVLGFGAVAGFAMWMKQRRQQPLTVFHLMAFFCVVSALVSAMVSDFPGIASLKVLSLLMLFLYCACGARYAIVGREEQFIRGLVFYCEIIVYASALAYLVLRMEVYGNRNALGAIIGVATFPILAWAALATDSARMRRRLTVCLLLSGFLLYYSASRASIAGAIVSGAVLCLVTAQRRALYKGAFYSILFLTVAGAVNPSGFAEFLSAQTAELVYKRGTGGETVFASRERPWHETVASIKKHPWFGSGFGTSDIGDTENISISHVYSLEGSNREHGNSYLALAEYMGLLGIVPFIGLLILTLRNVWTVCAWMRKTRSLRYYSVPLAMLIIGCLVHAFFEDWLFAVGNYLCLYFWICAFMVTDFVSTVIVPASGHQPRPSSSRPMESRLRMWVPER